MTPAAAETRLRDWLMRLAGLLQHSDVHTADLFRRVVAGRRAVVEIDAVRLLVQADDARPVTVDIGPAAPGVPATVRTSGDVLREIIDGRSLLDATIASDRLYVRAGLAELLAFHELVLHVLARAPREPALQALWAEFDAGWSGEERRCNPLDGQPARHGALRDATPAGVREARSPLFEPDGPPRRDS
ncbi:MAG TPA: hypothetical protein VFK29_03450 [Rhodanobacteraceae bacterium]|jgi:hypothetical protein|nr:hypothetical protein [Rhodanobacteraceae bacterium]